MGKTESALDILHEVGILACMLLFVVSGALLMLRYQGDGDFLPVLGGFVCMAIGAALLMRTPGRFAGWRKAHEERRLGIGAGDEADENELYDEALVRVRSP